VREFIGRRRRGRELPDPLLDLGGTYGDPEASDPIQDDELRIEHDRGTVQIVVPTALSSRSPATARR